MKVQKIKLSNIEQNENSRAVYKAGDLADLMASMKKDGLLQPVGVRTIGGGKYDAVFGNRRIVAANKLGWTEIHAHVVDIENDLDRDILGLIENLKRQNTSVAEDGRIFQSLRDRGLSVGEIAARLDLSEIRVNMALDVINVVPEEFRKKIFYSSPTSKRKRSKDSIPASTALAILNTRKSAGLNRAQTRTLFTASAGKGLNIQQIQKIAPLVKTGVSIEEALEQVADLERITLTVFMKTKDVKKIQIKYGKPVHTVLYDTLKSNHKVETYSTVGPANKMKNVDTSVEESAQA